MCGIFAILGMTNPGEALVSALKILQNRGYDSCGVCFSDSGRSLITEKFSSNESNSSIKMLENFLLEKDYSSIDSQSSMILHTRWATTGQPTVENAHPHGDFNNRISLVHNGIIENYQVLKDELISKGYEFKSFTDTEVISVMIGHYLDLKCSVDIAIKMTVARLMGTWALVILHSDYPHKIWVTRNGSPLLIGMGDEYVMIASEHVAFGKFIQKYVILDNHDLVEISKIGSIITYNIDVHRYKINHREQLNLPLSPIGFCHWMIKEIFEQPEAISRAMNISGRIKSPTMVKLGGMDLQYENLSKLEHIIILGCGTSYNAGLWAMGMFKSLKIFNTVSVIDGAEFSVNDVPLSGKTGLILVSQSGETLDLYRCIQIAKDLNIITIGVVNVVDSMIARETDCGVYLNAGREVAVASTKSFTNQCVILSLIAIWFSQIGGRNSDKRRKIISDLGKLQTQLYDVIHDNITHVNIMRTIASMFSSQNTSTLFILGKGSMHAIAMEGALKLKEVAYIHAEGYSTSALKHGALALITDDIPVIVFDIGDEFREKTQNCFREIRARGARVILITDNESNDILCDNNSDIICIDHNATFGGIIANCVVQLLSYFTALNKEHDPDFPRNLAKCVTVS